MAANKGASAEGSRPIDLPTLRRTETLIAGIARLYCSEDFTDLEIICKERVWKVHKFCLCAQSEFFQSACGGKFLEAENNRISLDEDDPQTVGILIHYFYHFDYVNYQQSGLSPIVLDVRMWVIADKYFVTPLKDLAAKKFKEGATAWWSTRAFADAVVEVYESAAKDSPLKETIIRLVVQHTKELLDIKKGYGYFLEVLGDVPEFGKDVSIAVATCRLVHNTYECPTCEHRFTMVPEATHFRCPRCDDVDNVTMYKSDWEACLVEDHGDDTLFVSGAVATRRESGWQDEVSIFMNAT